MSTRESPEDLDPSELVARKLVTLTLAGGQRRIIAATIVALLHAWAAQGPRGVVLTNEAGLILLSRPDTVRGANIEYFSSARLGNMPVPRGLIAIPPNLVVEVLGKGKTWNDALEKAAKYLRFGCDLVWMIDPAAKEVCVLRGDGKPVVLGGRDSLADPVVLPGFSCRESERVEF